MEEKIIFTKKHILFVFVVLSLMLCAVAQVSAEDVDNNVTIATEEIIQEDVSLSQDVSVENLEESDAQDIIAEKTKSFSEIQNLINSADEGDTIHLSGYYLGDGTEITIEKDDITIVGDDDDYDTTLDADGQSRIFYITGSNVVLKNLYLINGYADYGGAVYGGNLDDCIVAYNEASEGGGLYYSNAYNCYFAYNSAGYGGAMYDCYAEVCDFINNTADERGGAIYFSEDDNEIYDCYFENNTAGDDGGAIYNGDDSNLYIENCDFIINFASDDGGAIYNYGSIKVRDSYFYANEAGYWGGALCKCDAYNCTFEENYAQEEGGAMYSGNAYACSFETEYDTTVGTEIYDDLPESGESHTFEELQQLINNAKAGATIRISGIYYGSGTQITISKNNIVIEGEEWTYLDADEQSRIFYITGSNVVLKNLVLRNGYAEDGGAVYCDAYTNTLLDNCLVGLNKANDLGGATYYCDAYDTMFLRNSANRGGAMYGGNAQNSQFANNTATDRGGAIYARDGVTIDHCNFENNTADLGGAIYSCADYNTVSDCYFKSNYASDDGGAIYNNDEYDSGLTVLNSEFWYNEANDDGGAIYTMSYADTTVKNSYFRSNNAGYWGGAMYRGVAFDSQFYMNKAIEEGGGMYYGEAYDCAFTWNTPDNIYGTGAYVSIKGQISLSQSGSYFGDKTVSAKVINANNNNPISGAPVTFKFSNGKSATVYTGSNGVATYKVPFNPGTYRVTATIPSDIGGASAALANINIAKAQATITPTKLNTKFQKDKYFKVKVINSKTKKGIAGVKLQLKVYTGKKAKKVYITTDSSGNAYYNAAKLKIGKHKVKISIASSQVSAKAKTSKITVKKAATALDTYNGLYYYKDVKKGKYYIGIYNKDAGKYLKGIKLKVKVFTGKKSKTYTLKTKKDGFAILKTKGIKVGKHKVQITFKGNKKYKKSSAKTTIEVSKKIPTRVGYYYMFTTHIMYGGVTRSAKVYLKDMNGNDILNKKITLTGSYGDQTVGYSGELIRLPSGFPVVFRFAGDKKYMPSTLILT